MICNKLIASPHVKCTQIHLKLGMFCCFDFLFGTELISGPFKGATIGLAYMLMEYVYF